MIPRRQWGGLTLDDGDQRVASAAVLGVPWDGSACWRGGAAEAPARLREISHTSPAISERGEIVVPERFAVRDLGDVLPPDSAASDEDARTAYFERVSDAFVAAHRPQADGTLPFVLSLGGDHSVSIPLIGGFARAAPEPFGVVLLDAHPDLFDEYDDSRLSNACPMRRALETGGLDPAHLLIVGTRSYNRVELEFMRERDIRFVPAAEFEAAGAGEIVTLARERLSDVGRVYLTVDIDVADPACAPGTGAPVAGGLSSRQTLDLVRGLVDALPVRAMDLVEIAPALDPTNATLFLGLQIVFETFAVLARKQGAIED